MTPKRTRIIALILVGVLVFGLAATGISAADGIKRLICPADGFLVRRAFFRPFFGTARLIISL